MNRRSIRRIVSVFVVVMCIGAFGCIANAATHTDSVTFNSSYWGFSSSSHAVDLYPNTGVSTKLVSFTFNGMPSGSMPSGTTTISFKLVPKDKHNVNATGTMSHTYQNYISGTWKSTPFNSGIAHPTGALFTLASKSNASLGATVNGAWKLYY